MIANVNFKISGNNSIYAESLKQREEKIVDGALPKGGAFKGMSDGVAWGLGLAISLILLCVALFFLVWTLKRLFLGSAKRCIQKSVKINGYLAIIVGVGITILVQSSSMTTSALTPLVGIGTLPLEKMLPLTLGANLGTTCNATLASLVIGTDAAVQIALCHLFFNIFGILHWYPVPILRRIPLAAAEWNVLQQ